MGAGGNGPIRQAPRRGARLELPGCTLTCAKLGGSRFLWKSKFPRALKTAGRKARSSPALRQRCGSKGLCSAGDHDSGGIGKGGCPLLLKHQGCLFLPAEKVPVKYWPQSGCSGSKKQEKSVCAFSAARCPGAGTSAGSGDRRWHPQAVPWGSHQQSPCCVLCSDCALLRAGERDLRSQQRDTPAADLVVCKALNADGRDTQPAQVEVW